MDILALRKLAPKSVMGFGRYQDVSVAQMLDHPYFRSYLVWCYYALSKISFRDDVLDELNIDHRVDKPGACCKFGANEMTKMWRWNNFSEEEWQKYHNLNGHFRKVKKVNAGISKGKSNTKSYLRNLNQNHA